MSTTTTSLPVEVWKTVPHFEDYEVSNMGHVRSNKFGRTRILKAGDNGNGYDLVVLCREGGQTTFAVHKLVLNAFAGPMQPGQCRRHLNGNSKDNRLENLSYGTYRDNYDDAVGHGTAAIGNKLTWLKVRFIRALYKQRGHTQKELAEMFGVTQPNIGFIVRNQIWVEVA